MSQSYVRTSAHDVTFENGLHSVRLANCLFKLSAMPHKYLPPTYPLKIKYAKR